MSYSSTVFSEKPFEAVRMEDDFFAGIDALDADPELVESRDERKQFDKEFEAELLKQWSTAIKGKSAKQSSSATENDAHGNDAPIISPQPLLTSSPPPLEDVSSGDETMSRKEPPEIEAHIRSRHRLP